MLKPRRHPLGSLKRINQVKVSQTQFATLRCASQFTCPTSSQQPISRQWTSRRPIIHTQPCRTLASAVESVLSPKKTPLYDLHVENGGKMVEFGGHSMPVLYSGQSITDSAIWTREKASIFDVSHMTQHKFVGEGAAAFLESITPSLASGLKPFVSTYSTLLSDKAGIVDDTIITNITEAETTYHVVTNAGNYEVDLVYFEEELARFQKENPDKPLSWEVVENTGLIALQGPMASEILQSLNPHHEGKPYKFDEQTFGNARWLTFRDADGGNVSWPVLVARTGYTGEDGFELSIPHPEPSENTTLKLTNTILSAGGQDRIRLAGLGARDALRLEAGLCLHGHDINDTTTPIQASLIWIIPKPRRTADAGFKGAKVLYGPKEQSASSEIRRVGMTLEGKGPAAREGDKIYSDAECTNEIGTVTSGGPSPTLQKNIAMGYAQKDVAKADVPCWIKVRNKPRAAKFVKMPFVPTKYFKGTLVNPKK